MPSHRVYVHVPRPMEVVNADTVVEVRSGDEHLGDLHISRGSVDCRPTRASTCYWLEWEAFARLMVEHGQPHNPYAQ